MYTIETLHTGRYDARLLKYQISQMSIQYHRCYHRYLIFFVTFLILMIERKCLHIWGPMDPLSLSALVIPFIAVVQEMSHFGTLCDVRDVTQLY